MDPRACRGDSSTPQQRHLGGLKQKCSFPREERILSPTGALHLQVLLSEAPFLR